jgi:hypothetical protein
MLNVVKHPSLLIEDKQHQVPLPPGRSKLWSAVRMRERDDIVGLRRFLFLLVFGLWVRLRPRCDGGSVLNRGKGD